MAFGYRKEEVIGRTVREIDIWSDPGQPAEVAKRLASEHLVRNLVLQQRHRDGEPRTTLVSASLCTLGGEPHILASIKDITELKRAEVELRKLWRAVEQSSTAVVITDAAGDIEYVNSCFTAVTGYVREEVVGRSPSLLKSGLTSDADYRGMWSTIRQGDDWQGEFCNRRKDGSLYWATVTVSPVKTPDGTISHFIGMQTDITQRKRAEQELRASEERFRSLVETSLLGISIEQNGTPVFVNRTFATTFGYDEAEEVLALGSLDPLYTLHPSPGAPAAAGLLPAEGNTAQDRTPGHAASGHARGRSVDHSPGHTALSLNALGKALDDAPAQCEVRGIRKDGSVIWLDAQTRMIPWSGAVRSRRALSTSPCASVTRTICTTRPTTTP
jgi:PAS domain S-box-containing protein